MSTVENIAYTIGEDVVKAKVEWVALLGFVAYYVIYKYIS